MNNKFNVWSKWDPLKTVMLGDCYAPEFFRDIKNARIRSALDRIATETKQDLEYYEKVLKDFGCRVLRPRLDKKESIMDHINDSGQIWSRFARRAPLQPRDFQAVFGNLLYIFSDIFPYKDHYSIVRELFDYSADTKDIKVLYGGDRTAPCFTLVGKDLYVDLRHVEANHIKKINEHIPDIRINTLMIGGHNDGCFHTLKPGALISLCDIQHYEQTFPGWDVCYLENQSWDLVEGWMTIKKKVGGKWWVPGEEHNDDFITFVETWLQDWVGFCEESVFDVNVLMLDEKHVCVNNHNDIAFDFFKKHKIEPIIVPWRHRYFWDGGLHCITLDLYREGMKENYFPCRQQPIIDLGFD